MRELRFNGLKSITAGYLLTTYIGAATQHALRMSFVTTEEAQYFDDEVTQTWSEMVHRDCSKSPKLLFLPMRNAGPELSPQPSDEPLPHGLRGDLLYQKLLKAQK